MERTVRQYVQRVLAIHLAGLLLIVAVVALAAWAVYAAGEERAEAAAIERLRQPASAAADEVTRHFAGVFATLDVDRTDLPGGELAPILWGQLQNRLSDLLVVRTDPGGAELARRFSHPDTGTFESDDALAVPATLLGAIDDEAGARRLVANNAEFLQNVAAEGEPALSDPLPRGDRDDDLVMLAAAPAPGEAGGVHVAVVPVAHLERQFLTPAAGSGRAALVLIDAATRMVAGAGPDRTVSVDEAAEAGRLPASLAEFVAARVAGRSVPPGHFPGRVDLMADDQADDSGVLALVIPVRSGLRLDDEDAAEPAEAADDDVPPAADAEAAEPSPGDAADARRGRLWVVALLDRGEVVGPLREVTGTAILWAAALILAVSGILVSSGTQLIRGRGQIERLRREVVDKEMREARQIQLRWLPHTRRPGGGRRRIDVAAENVPASHVSGDFYNYFPLPNPNANGDGEEAGGRFGLVVGDVTGHGMAAAFLMSTAQLLIRTSLARTGDPGRTLTEVNDILAAQSAEGAGGTGGQFVTVLLAVLDPARGGMHVANAGHGAPLACDRDGRWVEMPVEGELVLGVMEGTQYPTSFVPLDKARAILFYTDGAVEATNAAGERFDVRQLCEGLRSEMPGGPKSAAEVVEGSLRVVRGFAGGEPFEDDVTLLAVRPDAADPADAPAAPHSFTEPRAAEPASAGR